MADTPLATAHPTEMARRHVNFLIVQSIMSFVSTLVVLLRFIQRKRLTAAKRFGWDDWAILVALVWAYGNLVGAVLDKWSGYHIWEYAPDKLIDQLNNFAKVSSW